MELFDTVDLRLTVDLIPPNVGEGKTVLFTSFFLVFQHKISLCILGHLGTLSVDQASPELRDLTVSILKVQWESQEFI